MASRARNVAASKTRASSTSSRGWLGSLMPICRKMRAPCAPLRFCTRIRTTTITHARWKAWLQAWTSNGGQVIVEDFGVAPIPEDPAEYAADRLAQPMRDDIKALEITQPDGPSFEVDGQVVRWQKWQLRVSLNPVEGLVLHDVRYDDDGRDRPILYRASLSDMVVPYGDSSPMHYWKHAFDAGETTMGHSANSLKLGCDCLGEIYYFDSTILLPNGEPLLRENSICMHEEDYGILWKHDNTFRRGSARGGATLPASRDQLYPHGR